MARSTREAAGVRAVTTLVGPLIEDGRVTTLVGPPGLELAALTCAIAASYQSGREVVPGLEPKGLGKVMAYSYLSDWATWRGLLSEVSDVAGVAEPYVDLRCVSDPWGQPVERDPDSLPFWEAAISADIDADVQVARSIGRQFAPCLTIIFGYGISAASGFGSDLRRLYDQFRATTTTALVVDGETPYTAPTWANWTWAGTYGPIHRLVDLRDDSAVSAFLERIAARYVADVGAEPEPRPSANGTHRLQRADVYALLEECGMDAVRQLSTDGNSVASKRLKALARERGLGPGALYHAARRIADAQVRSHELTHRVAGRGPGTLYGYAARFNEWREVDSMLEGHFLQRFAPGCFAQTIAEVHEGRKVTFRHGRDPRFGHKSLGPITLLEEDSVGLRYEVELFDADHTWELAPWLATGRYGGSLTFEVLRDTFVRCPGTSAHNPRGLSEQTVTEIRVQEFGPVDPPAYRGTSCGVRSAAIANMEAQ
jgi:phage head maturation protease